MADTRRLDLHQYLAFARTIQLYRLDLQRLASLESYRRTHVHCSLP
jgi:hypothetical protein